MPGLPAPVLPGPLAEEAPLEGLQAALQLKPTWAQFMNTPTETISPAPLDPRANGRDQPGPPVQDNGESGEDPYSPGLQPLAALTGALIGILSVTVPLVAVVTGRSTPTVHPPIHGSQTPAGIPSARAGEPGGGDSSRLPQ
jgi:hypothetical protein